MPGMRSAANQTTAPASAIARAVRTRAVSSPPLGCGSSREIATRAAPATSSASVARALVRAVWRMLTRFSPAAMPRHRQTPAFPLAADHLELGHKSMVLVVEHVAVDHELAGVVGEVAREEDLFVRV